MAVGCEEVIALASVAIVGRPNVGKSALFNRIVGRREAIVADMPGVTRDVKSSLVELPSGAYIQVLDTGGLWSADEWQTKIHRSIEASIAGVDLILFCVDGRAGLHHADYEVADWLRKFQIPVLLVATKIDDPQHTETAEFFELYNLGFGEPFPTAALHQVGMNELIEYLDEQLPDSADEAAEEKIKLAIIGRPNVGKSSIVNTLVGDERVLVADSPGTTRDSVDVDFEYAGREFTLIDTAGIRRRLPDDDDIEFYAKLRSEAAIRRASVCILVVDAQEFGDHEMRLANIALEIGKPVILAINKWDLVPEEAHEEFQGRIEQELYHLLFAPRVYTSATENFGMHEMLAGAVRLFDQAHHRVPTGELNQWLTVWTTRQEPPNFQGKPLRMLYISQVDVAPPTFHFSVNNVNFLTRPYEHYLRNRIREDLGFPEVPIRMVFKERGRGSGKKVRT